MKEIDKLIDRLGWTNLANEIKYILKSITTDISNLISDAPIDGNTYGRKDGSWEQVQFEEAPIDNQIYGRINSEWEKIPTTKDFKEVLEDYTFILEDKNKVLYNPGYVSDPKFIIPKDLFDVGDELTIRVYHPALTITKEDDINFEDIVYDGYSNKASYGFITIIQESTNVWSTKSYSTGLPVNAVSSYLVGIGVDTIPKYYTHYYSTSGTDINIKTSENITYLNTDAFFLITNKSTQNLTINGTDEPNGDYIKYNGEILNSVILRPGETGYFKMLPTASFPLEWDFIRQSSFRLPGVNDDFIDDTEAASNGILVGDMYHTSGVVKIRII